MELIPSFGKTIFDSSSDITIDALEACFDELADKLLSDEHPTLNPLLQNLPVVRYFISAGKTALAVKEYCFVKKSLRFFSQLKKGTVNKEAMEKRRTALAKREKWIYHEIELLVSILDRLDEEAKAKVIAELYIAYLNGELSPNRQLNEYEFHDLFPTLPSAIAVCVNVTSAFSPACPVANSSCGITTISISPRLLASRNPNPNKELAPRKLPWGKFHFLMFFHFFYSFG